MAGTIPNLPLSTQFDKDTGLPLRGGLLYFFQAGTVATPQNAFRDSGLTQAHPNPITLDGAGRVPSFYLSDGAIHVRLQSAQGVTQFEDTNLLVVGPSSGSGGGGSSVDPTAIFQTGDTLWLDQQGTRAGWVRDNGRTIGSATSGASERANTDCQALFLYGWAAGWTVVGGSGVSAAADWAANKQITLPDKRGYAPAGLDDMGNTAAGRFAGVPFASGSATAAGALAGEATHALSTAEMPAHAHTASVTDPGHSHYEQYTSTAGPSGITGNSSGSSPVVTSVPTSSAVTGITVANANTGGGGAHNNTGLRVLGTFYRKL